MTNGDQARVARIVAAHGRSFLVHTGTGELLRCVTRGKETAFACGDHVRVRATSKGEGVIESLIDRSTLFFRSSPARRKIIAANATHVLILAAAEPSFSDELIARALIAAEHQGMSATIALNKSDLPAIRDARIRLAGIETAGYEVIEIAACPGGESLAAVGIPELRRRIERHVTILAGQSGMGKSSLINALFPNADAHTREISHFLESGKHTTTHARLYPFEFTGEGFFSGPALIDSPGIQEFGLAHIPRSDIAGLMPDIARHAGHCRFANCRHLQEPACGIRAARDAGRLDERRYEIFTRIATSPY